MQTMKMKWTGIRPLVMHNGLLADPANEYTKAIKAITSKGSKKMTDADHEERNRLEWEGGLYWNDELGAVIPSDNIERCIQLGAQKSRIGKDVQAVVFCIEPEIPIQYDGPRDKKKLYQDRFILTKGVRVTTSRIIRVRPRFPVGWSLNVEVEFDETIVNPKNLLKACIDSGALVGLGDWRPKYGRFTVDLVE